MRALIWDGEKLELTDKLEVRAPGPGEVRVRVLSSGICHSDVTAMHSPRGLPVVLGHEAAGEIVELGDDVTGWKVGDRVVAVAFTPCGQCRECARGAPANCDVTFGFEPNWPFSLDGTPVASFCNVASFASEIVVQTGQLFKVDDIPPEQAALIGCAVATGYGAAARLGQVGPGDRVVVIGVGGIGVNAIQTAHQAGATVLAVDLNPDKEKTARHFGAEAFLCAKKEMKGVELAAAIQAAFAPVDVAIDCSGAPSALEATISCTKRGGRAVLIGMPLPGAKLQVDADTLVYGRTVVAEIGGGNHPHEDIPKIVDQVKSGRIDVANQVTSIWPLSRADEAIAALISGTVTRVVLDHRLP